MTGEVLIYGSYGYTGSLIARGAVDAGLSPTLAGRRAEPVEEQATTLDCDHRVFSLEHRSVVEAEIADADVVLNCAGPFSRTARPLYGACIEAGTDYLDITGEVDVLEAIAERDRAAERAEVTLLPAVGFDVVPTDCLAAFLHERLPEAARLVLAIDGVGTASGGTLKSVIEGLDTPGAIRDDGALREMPAAWKVREIDFGPRLQPTGGRTGHGGTGKSDVQTGVTIPWGDVSTGYRTTGIPDIEVYAAVPERAVWAMRKSRALAPLLRSGPVKRALETVVDATVSGPSPEERSRNSCRIWGEVVDGDDGRVVARMRTPDPYELTATTAVEAARRALGGEVPDGFQTPASAFGPEFAPSFDGVDREIVDPADRPTTAR